MTPSAIPTLAGQAALAAALDNGPPIIVSEMVVGDGNGVEVTPLETQTHLVNLRDTVPVSSHVRDGNKVTFEGILGVDNGGYVVREVGFLDINGVLLFTASYPATMKLTQAENTSDELYIAITVVISDTAIVVLQPPAGSLVSIADMLRAPHLTVDSATLTEPPANPAVDNCYLVPQGATGAWAGNAGRLAQWNGSAWVFKIVPITHLIGVADSGKYMQRTANGWREVFIPTYNVSRAALLFYGSI